LNNELFIRGRKLDGQDYFVWQLFFYCAKKEKGLSMHKSSRRSFKGQYGQGEVGMCQGEMGVSVMPPHPNELIEQRGSARAFCVKHDQGVLVLFETFFRNNGNREL